MRHANRMSRGSTIGRGKRRQPDGWRKDVSEALPANYLHHTLDTGVLLGVAEDVHVKVEKAVCPCP